MKRIKGIDDNKVSMSTLKNLKGSLENRVREIYRQAYKVGYKDGWKDKTNEITYLLTNGWSMIGVDKEQEDER